MHPTLRGLHSQLDLFIYAPAVLTTLAILTDDTNSTNTSSHRGRRQRRQPSNPPPPACRGQGVPNAFADSDYSYRFADTKASPGHRLLPPTLAAESLFSHLRLIFPDFVSFWGPLINSSKIGPLSNPTKTSKIGPLGAPS